MVNIRPSTEDDCGKSKVARPAASPSSAGPARIHADGLHVLQPLICSRAGARQKPPKAPSAGQLDALYNERGLGADEYPLDLRNGLYFSEALGQANADAAQYESLINWSLDLIIGQCGERPMPLRTLFDVGQSLQELDSDFASAKIAQPLDCLHRCTGTDVKHPYAKITICRTTFPVEIMGRSVPFYFEKFLVAYSYLNEQGQRRSTVTPVHSHPINFETAYFTHYGDQSCAVEQEFDLYGADGASMVGPEQKISADFRDQLDSDSIRFLRAVPAGKTIISPAKNPTVLAPFTSEIALKEDEERLVFYDGLFRPHRVEVKDDPDTETRYFAMDNYFGPTGRVLVFDEAGEVRQWKHHEWVTR